MALTHIMIFLIADHGILGFALFHPVCTKKGDPASRLSLVVYCPCVNSARGLTPHGGPLPMLLHSGEQTAATMAT